MQNPLRRNETSCNCIREIKVRDLTLLPTSGSLNLDPSTVSCSIIENYCSADRFSFEI